MNLYRPLLNIYLVRAVRKLLMVRLIGDTIDTVFVECRMCIEMEASFCFVIKFKFCLFSSNINSSKRCFLIRKLLSFIFRVKRSRRCYENLRQWKERDRKLIFNKLSKGPSIYGSFKNIKQKLINMKGHHFLFHINFNANKISISTAKSYKIHNQHKNMENAYCYPEFHAI